MPHRRLGILTVGEMGNQINKPASRMTTISIIILMNQAELSILQPPLGLAEVADAAAPVLVVDEVAAAVAVAEELDGL